MLFIFNHLNNSKYKVQRNAYTYCAMQLFPPQDFFEAHSKFYLPTIVSFKVAGLVCTVITFITKKAFLLVSKQLLCKALLYLDEGLDKD